MPYDVLMPQLGMTMTEGTVVKWLKTPGEAVEKGEFLVIIQTDKVDIEIESPWSGTFTGALIELGQTVPVGTPIGRIARPDSGDAQEAAVKNNIATTAASSATSSNESQREESVTSVAMAVPVSTGGQERKLATPRAKKVALELGLDISRVPDYSARGKIVEEDVRRFFEEGSQAEGIPQTKGEIQNTASAARKAIAERMTISFRTIPHFYVSVLADATGIVKFREDLLNDVTGNVEHVSYTDILLKALALALRTHPDVNAYWDDRVVRRESINVGFATQSTDRLVVPVIRGADRLSLTEIAGRRSVLASRARSGKLHIDDVGDASCTLSNLGPQGVDSFNAIINPPESIILAAGRIAPRPLVVNGAVVPRQTVYLSLSADHRVIDGSTAAGFLQSLVNILGSPHTLET